MFTVADHWKRNEADAVIKGRLFDNNKIDDLDLFTSCYLLVFLSAKEWTEKFAK